MYSSAYCVLRHYNVPLFFQVLLQLSQIDIGLLFDVALQKLIVHKLVK